MVGQNSDLSAFGYDVVVATTQRSINGAIKNYFEETTFTPQAVTVYYGELQGVKYAYYSLPDFVEFMAANNCPVLDPFELSSWDGTGGENAASSAILQQIGFLAGFSATIGAPAGYFLPSQMPNPVILKPATQSVIFTLLCSSFQVVGFNAQAGFVNQSQPADGDPWLFQSTVPLDTLTDSSNLPSSVQAQVDALTAQQIDFSVQKLIFDLDNALLTYTPTISGVPANQPSIYEVLNQYFIGSYFSQMKATGQPILNYIITQSTPEPGSLVINAVEPYAEAMVDANGNPLTPPTLPQQNCSTLNYLCAVNGNSLSTGKQINWNWLELSDTANYDGAVAISRNALINYFRARGLDLYLALNTKVPSVTVQAGLSGNLGYAEWFPILVGGKPVTPVLPAAGPTVLTYSYQSATASGTDPMDPSLGQMSLDSSFDLSIDFVNIVDGNGNQAGQILLNQHYVVHMVISSMGQTLDTNVIDIQGTHSFLLEISDTGNLLLTDTSTNTSTAQTNGMWMSFPDNQARAENDLKEWLAYYDGGILTGLAFGSDVVQNLVFPGGNTFAFKSVAFSDSQDLVCPITYQNQ